MKINEKEIFYKTENCPLVYIVIIPRLLKLGQKEAKKDQILKNAVKAAEKVVNKLDKKTLSELEKAFNVFAIIEMFKMTNNMKVIFKNYFTDIKTFICSRPKTFSEVLEMENMMDDLYNCDAFEVLKNNI